MYQSKRKGFSRGLDRLLSTPSLMKGEDENVYAELYARVEEVAQPQDVWEQMMVADVVNHFWEQQPYRRCTGTIINSERRSALKNFSVTPSDSIPPTPQKLRTFTSVSSGMKTTDEPFIPIRPRFPKRALRSLPC
jgi:hypothetical protein